MTGIDLLYTSYFGRGSGPILFAYLNCDGTESRLSDCTYSSYPFWASHSSDAGVRCQPPTVTSKHNVIMLGYSVYLFILTEFLAQADCANGDVRLVNGTTLYEGRVEICYDGVWGSVCDRNWDYWDAAIVCLQMGFQGTSKPLIRTGIFARGGN